MFERARQYLHMKHTHSTVCETPISDRETVALKPPLHQWPNTLQPRSERVIEPDTQMVSSPVTLKTVTAASVYHTGGRHVVITSTGKIVSQHRVSSTTLAELPWQPYQQLSGRTLLLGNSAGAGCYYHWMLDILPKLGYLERAGIDLNNIDHFLVRKITTDFQRSTLSSMGIAASRITECSKHPYFTCEELLIVNLEHRISFGMNRFVPQWVNRKFQTTQATDHNNGRHPSTEDRIKLFIKRPEGVRRAIVNEDALINLLTSEGFTIATMEGLSVQEQAALLARTDVLVAAHGGALTNMVFAQPGTQIIELFGSHVYPYYYGLANLCNHNYHALLQHVEDYANLVQLKTAMNNGTAQNQSISQNASFSVDLNALADCLLTTEITSVS